MHARGALQRCCAMEAADTARRRAAVAVQAKAERFCGQRFNSCLLNLYRDGSDTVGWHSDDEKLYGRGCTICSVSLGHARDFQLRRKGAASRKLCWCLGEGDLFVMAGALQPGDAAE